MNARYLRVIGRSMLGASLWALAALLLLHLRGSAVLPSSTTPAAAGQVGLSPPLPAHGFLADTPASEAESWQPVPGPYGGSVAALALSPSYATDHALFAGTDESPGELVFYQNRSYKSYRGMGSQGAMAKGHSSDRYGHSVEAGLTKVAPEGIEGRVPYKGSLENIVPVLLAGIRSGMGYCGASSIRELHKKAKFIRITHHGLRESHVHDVLVTKEAPNYRVEE